MKFYIFFLFILAINSQSDDDESQYSNEINIMKGWLKFFTFTPDFRNDGRPTKFEYNSAFLSQKNAYFTENDKDEWGWFNIPTDTSFFFVLTKKTLYVIKARRVLIIFISVLN